LTWLLRNGSFVISDKYGKYVKSSIRDLQFAVLIVNYFWVEENLNIEETHSCHFTEFKSHCHIYKSYMCIIRILFCIPIQEYLSQVVIYLRPPSQKFRVLSSFIPSCYMGNPSYSPWFHRPTNYEAWLPCHNRDFLSF
jgi:hypothetical protein